MMSGVAPSHPGVIRVLVVGAYPVVTMSLRGLLRELPGLQPEEAFPTCGELLGGLPGLAPDVVLWVFPQPEELAHLPMLQRQCAPGRVLCLGLAPSPEEALAALQAGATGYLTAGIPPAELALALRQAARGEITLSADLAQGLLTRLTTGRKQLAPETLTPREHEILALVGQGWANKAIAQHLFLSLRTVENHLANIYGKLGVRSRTEAAVLALQSGWARDPVAGRVGVFTQRELSDLALPAPGWSGV